MKTTKLLSLAVGLMIGSAANAALVSHTIDITATNFTGGTAPPAPISPFQLDFSVTFDNAANIAGTTTGLTINSFNLPYPAQYAYSQALDTLILATSASTGGCGNPPSSFCVFIKDFSTSPDVYFVQQSTAAASNNYWTAQTIVARVDAVPEPGSLALVGLALAGVAGLRRSGRSGGAGSGR